MDTPEPLGPDAPPATLPAGGVSRRTVVASAAWSVPVIAAAVAAPMAAASVPPREFAIESSFGVGWYPVTQGQTSSGALQYDADAGDKYFRVTGTQPGDVVSNVFFQALISVGWPALTFVALPGSNGDWTTLAATGATETVNGVSYRVYQSTYTPPVVATGATTSIPVDFFFRASSPYYANQTAITRRFASVAGTTVALVRNPAAINNTNVLLSSAPTP
ncbi:hypothetical protein N1031_12610 [Herbiconiux moechotypicola]|uniref:Uncharacterized protein n=1 Tax=Herbiconiux moechotypicola TaxID=637393 RepID=A0ABN3DSJ5_9MICO|nr:hypothetical protein [Herbiconiux moechotypicola]MCS5730605.1 hypothetical protein [Herbiconiux moechotypicola]